MKLTKEPAKNICILILILLKIVVVVFMFSRVNLKDVEICCFERRRNKRVKKLIEKP